MLLRELLVVFCVIALGSAYRVDQPTCTGPNEEYVLEKQTCPPEECWSIAAFINCSDSPPPQPGCACKPGFMRLNATSPCVPTCECPQMINSPDCKHHKPGATCTGSNEEYVLEKQTCPPEECWSIAAFINCSDSPPPQPGCACKPGFMRLNATSPCVPTCECPQMINSPDCKHHKPEVTCGPNEEFTLEKRSCPPELCVIIVAFINCSNTPSPQPGCACKPGFLRVNDTSPCVPTCKCPQLANEPNCV